MKIHNYGSDYAFQHKLKESGKVKKDAYNSVDGTQADAGEVEMGTQYGHSAQEAEDEAPIGTEAEEKEVSKKKKKAGNR